VQVIVDVPVIDDDTVFLAMDILSRAIDLPMVGNVVVTGKPTQYSTMN
jgi:hypothetical protein